MRRDAERLADIAAYPEVPWRQIIAMRNRVVHGYFEADLNILWDVAIGDVPSLLDQVQAILAELTPAPDGESPPWLTPRYPGQLHASCTAILLPLALTLEGRDHQLPHRCNQLSLMDAPRDAILERLVPEVTVTTNRADDVPVPPDRGTESLDEQARRKDIRPIQSADDLAQDGIFDTDEELDAFLAHVAAMRHADLA